MKRTTRMFFVILLISSMALCWPGCSNGGGSTKIKTTPTGTGTGSNTGTGTGSGTGTGTGTLPNGGTSNVNPSGGSGGDIAPGSTGVWGGVTVYIPTSYNPATLASPVVWLFNENIPDWKAVADANGIIIIDLDEYNNEPALHSKISQTEPKLEAEYNVDKARYYYAGFSAGGNIAIIFTDANQGHVAAAMSFPGSYQPAPSIPSERPNGAKYYYAVGSLDTAYAQAIPKACAAREAQGYTVRYDIVQGCGHYISESQYHKRADAWDWVKNFNVKN